ncbi:MAG: LysR family transcriptional regulator [Betaproteobacteria bacterium]
MTELARQLDWSLLRSFLAVIDAGSLSGAARATQGHQPTMSRDLAELEQQLGVALFERTGRGVRPTAAGLGVLPAARQMQAAAEALARVVTSGREATKGTVRVTASQVVATWLLPPLIVEFQRAEPEIAIELVAANTVQNLLRREADIALRMLRPEQGSLIARKLADVGIGAYAHVDYLAVAGTPATVADLTGHRLIGYDRDETIIRGFARAGVTLAPAHFAVRTDDQVANGQLLAAGAGIGFAAHYCAAQWPGLRRVLPELPVPSMPCWLAVHRELRGNGVVKRVYDFLAEAVPARLAALAQPAEPGPRRAQGRAVRAKTALSTPPRQPAAHRRTA